MDAIPKQEFRVRDLATRSVTLFPTRAQVVRDIKNITLKHGLNEIVILGLSPSVDEDSIKVEGTGTAIISDIAVEMLPNREIFEEIYPEYDVDSESEDEEDSYHDVSNDVSPAMSEIRHKLTLLDDEKKRIDEAIANADSRLKILDEFTKSVSHERVKVDIASELDTYRQEREKVFKDHMEYTIKAREVARDRDQLKDEEEKQRISEGKENDRQAKIRHKNNLAKTKEKLKKQRRKAEVRREKRRIQQERERFWPRRVWSVRITLDAVNPSSPASSRRSSIASASDLVKVEPGRENSDTVTYNCDLSLSYVVSNAWWTPSYDLSLSTTTNTATLCFDAQLTNRTSENWTNCKIILSTSQATFAGLQDAIPTLVPWRVRLGGKTGSSTAIMQSREETNYKGTQDMQQQTWYAEKARQHLYGIEGGRHQVVQCASAPGDWRMSSASGPRQQQQQQALMQQQQQQQQQQQSHFQMQMQGHLQSLRRQDAPALMSVGGGGGGLFGSSNLVTEAYSAPPPPGASGYSGMPSAHDQTDEYDETHMESLTLTGVPPPPTPLDFQESSSSETGLTTTYDLPGTSKSLLTSPTNNKQRVARVSFSSVTFSHTIIAKYKPVAYLKTKLHNASKLTLLKGPVGLTLDGTFMGRSTLPRCSAGDYLTLSLGMDPAILVVYPKPDVKRSTTGVFSKEDSSVYTRSITVTNTRAQAGKAINLAVLDQVPVSEDERLRIGIVTPRGLAVGGESVRVGKGIATGGKEGDWGRASARLKKGGEVVWDVVLNAGKGCKLVLEYEVGVPGGDSVVQC